MPEVIPPDSTFEKNMAVFAAFLRAEGLPLGTAELLDALQALEHIDIGEKAGFKDALRATLVKSYRDLEVFERVFERYFVPTEIRIKQLQEARQQREHRQIQLENAAEELSFKGEPLDLTHEEMLLYSNLPLMEQQSLRRFILETEAAEKERRPLRPLLETVVKGQLRYWRSRRELQAGGTMGGEGGAGRVGKAEKRLYESDIRMLGQTDLPAARALINRLSQQLARRLLQRRHRSALRGSLDFRRTVRVNMRHGGQPFLLKHKRKRRSKLQLLFIGDLSASMERYSSFVLQFIYGLQTAVSNLELFSFADSLEYLTPVLKQQAGLEGLLERLVLKGQSWGGGTNIGAALSELNGNYRELLMARTVVIVVSDTRTINQKGALGEVQRLKERVRRIIWLNPLPPEQWAHHSTVAAFGELVEMWPCNTIAQLEEAVAGRLFTTALLID